MTSQPQTYEAPTAPTYDDFQSAYLTALDQVFHRPQFVNAPRGNKSRELLGVSFRLTDARQRHIELASRKSNIVFCFAELLWYLSGRDDLDFIAQYAPGIRRYSQDGLRLTGTAYGPRIFRSGAEGINQWDVVVQELRRDSDSKRAVITIYEPRETLVPDNIDVACTLGLQFFVRDGALHCQSYMRANDAFVGVVSDVFSFTGIQEVMARQLGLELGSLTHSVGSYHLYLNDADRAERVLAEAREDQRPAHPFPAMPDGDNWPQIHSVINYLEQLHSCTSPSALPRPEAMGLSQYWRDVATMFYLHRQHALSVAVDRTLLGALPQLYQVLLAQRWPDAFGLDR